MQIPASCGVQGDGNLVVAMHLYVAAQLAEILRQVVGKRIVVVEQQNHTVAS